MLWLVLGASPRAPWALRLARYEHRIDRTITTNAGIWLEPNPDFYFLSDSEACRMFQVAARRCHSQGTRCVTLARLHSALVHRQIDWFDEFVDCTDYEPFQLSGLFCLEYAAKRAETVLLVGMDGYDPRKTASDYFDPRACLGPKTTHIDMTQRVIEPKMRKIVAKYPRVNFICYGIPRFAVEGDNWTIRPA